MVATQTEEPLDWPEDYGTSTLVDWQFRTAEETEIPPYTNEKLKHTGPQGHVEPFTVIDDPAAWTVADIMKDKSWIYELTEEDIEEIDAAIAGVEAKDMDIKDVTKEDFPLPKLKARLEAIGKEVSHGRGFFILRKLPVKRYSVKQAILAIWGMGLYWGNHQVQDKLGQMVSHVKDNGTNPKGFHTRAYTTNSAQPIHNDNADIVGLLCLRKAKKGGLSQFASQVAIHNELLKRGRRDLVEVLADGQWWLHKDGWNATGGGLDRYYNHPVFNYYKGYMTGVMQGAFYFKSQANSDVPRITAKEIEALRMYTALAISDELRVDWVLEPGDIQLLHNASTVHTRSAFENGEDEDSTRHLIRIWIANPDERPLPEIFKWMWGSTELGNRGGWHVPLGKAVRHIPLAPLPANT